MQAGRQVSSAILFRVLLFNRIIIEKALSQITNMEHIFSAKSLKQGLKRAIAWLPPRLRAWLPFNYFEIASFEFP